MKQIWNKNNKIIKNKQNYLEWKCSR